MGEAIHRDIPADDNDQPNGSEIKRKIIARLKRTHNPQVDPENQEGEKTTIIRRINQDGVNAALRATDRQSAIEDLEILYVQSIQPAFENLTQATSIDQIEIGIDQLDKIPEHIGGPLGQIKKPEEATTIMRRIKLEITKIKAAKATHQDDSFTTLRVKVKTAAAPLRKLLERLCTPSSQQPT